MRYVFMLLVFLGIVSCNEKDVPATGAPAVSSKAETVILPAPGEDKMETRRDVPIGKIDGYEIVYDCINCMQAFTESITVYSKKESSKTKLFDLPIEDYYIDRAEVLTLLGDTFIYIGSTHTHGHSQGYLYAFDVRTQKAIRVLQEASTFKIPDILQIRNWGGLAKDDSNKFSDWGSLRSKAGGNEERLFTQAYTLVKLKNGSYTLKPGKAAIE